MEGCCHMVSYSAMCLLFSYGLLWFFSLKKKRKEGRAGGKKGRGNPCCIEEPSPFWEAAVFDALKCLPAIPSKGRSNFYFMPAILHFDLSNDLVVYWCQRCYLRSGITDPRGEYHKNHSVCWKPSFLHTTFIMFWL